MHLLDRLDLVVMALRPTPFRACRFVEYDLIVLDTAGVTPGVAAVGFVDSDHHCGAMLERQ
jgi:hypothetical protein